MTDDMDWADALAVVVVAESYRDDEIDETMLRRRIAEALRANAGRSKSRSFCSAEILFAGIVDDKVFVTVREAGKRHTRSFPAPWLSNDGLFRSFMKQLGPKTAAMTDTSELRGLAFNPETTPAWEWADRVG